MEGRQPKRRKDKYNPYEISVTEMDWQISPYMDSDICLRPF